ncbi:MAG: 5-deoxy-glucuronate isomerase [Hyphomonadaceae bacterium]
MSKLRVRPHEPAADGCVLEITPESAGWKFVGFKVVKLAAGQTHKGRERARETCIVILSGKADVKAGDEAFAGIGGRANVFEDAAPACVYVPSETDYSISALSDVEVALCSAPGEGVGAPRLISSDKISLEKRGQGTNTRFVRNILPETEPAESLLIAEVITPGGHWSSYPPHKHDRDAAPVESALEETYYHRLNPAQGFAFQRVYTDDRSLDETVCVEDGDVVMVPKGYHPVGAPHGYDLYYLNVMAGPKRTWIFKNDPAHEWIVKK